MGSFGETVASLLDTYTKCLSLLKGLRQHGRPSDSQSRLGTSIRSDRAKVRRVYSSRRSLKGASFEKGDATARSSLRKVIKKLTTTLERLMRSVTTSQRDPVDYESLMSLSSRSRLDAIRTMTDLSSRVSSTSSLSSTRSRGKKNRRKSKPQDAPKARSLDQSKTRSVAPREPDRAPLTGSHSHGHGHGRRHEYNREVQDKRFSMLTTSSGSTKLGEIRRRRDDNDAIYDGRATYPLHPYASQKKESKRWWGLFGKK